MLPLTPALRPYAWGTPDDIARILKMDPPGGPVAEAWWGAHPEAPSLARVAGTDRPLNEVLAPKAPNEPQLPYLLKILAIAHSLSIQVHPNAGQAKEGFAADEKEGRPLSDPARTFKDSHPKPEMLIALEHTEAFSGVRPLDDIRHDLQGLGPAGSRLADLINGSVAKFLAAVLDGEGAEALDELTRADAHTTAVAWAKRAATYFPSDPGALVAMALNAVTIEPGQALFTGAGIIHSYQRGLGIEIMRSSDNVVRAGLTDKPTDTALLERLAITTPTQPVVITPKVRGAARTYLPPVDDFALTVVENGGAMVNSGHRIVVVLEGAISVSASGEHRTISVGHSLLVGEGEGLVSIDATAGKAMVGHVPDAAVSGLG